MPYLPIKSPHSWKAASALACPPGLFKAVALRERIAQETSFDGYRVVRMNEMPQVENHIIPTSNRPTGMEEPGLAPISPAVANAILALIGRPTGSLP